MKKPFAAISIALIFSGALVWVAGIGSDTALSIKMKGEVEVTGYATQKITSDLGLADLTVQAKDTDIKLAYDKLAAGRTALKQYIDSFRFDAGDVTVSPVEVREKFKINSKGFELPELDHLIVSQTFTVRSPDVRQVEKMAADAGGLMGRGIDLRASAPRFIYTPLNDLKIEMIGRASANAKERAETLSKNGKFRLGNVSQVRVGVFQITPANSTDISDYGLNDTSSIEKEIKSTVEVHYFVK
ncbi:MAG: SIMPL domain-containing protein [Candidatus Omnitrophica bacterium]|nr:SIMPL domain-containing protein [Candidatus Omnitrophota bacterium]